jgi:hypothetical protein
MSEYQVSFIVQGKVTVDGLFGTLSKLKPHNLDIRPIVQKNALGKKGGGTAVEALVAYLKRNAPQSASTIQKHLMTVGFSSAYTPIGSAIKQKLIRKTKDGFTL